MLPRADGFWRTYFNRFVCLQCPDTIRNNAILCPVTTSYNITCPNTGNTYMVFLAIVLRIEETSSP